MMAPVEVSEQRDRADSGNTGENADEHMDQRERIFFLIDRVRVGVVVHACPARMKNTIAVPAMPTTPTRHSATAP